MDIANLPERLNLYVLEVQKMQDEYWEKMKFVHQPSPKIETSEGHRYIKIIKVDYRHDGTKVSSSVHSFIDRTNGNILKGSWKAPVANGVRGNIFNEVCTKGVDHHGPLYLR